MNIPFVSIIMLAYNHEKYIGAAIDSVFIQEGVENLELIISNDFSTDSTNLIITDIISKHPKRNKIKYFNHTANMGIGKNFAFSLKQCSGKYIAICDGDDFWIDRLKLKKQSEILESDNHYSMVCSNQMLLLPDGSLNKNDFITKNIINTKDVVEGFIPAAQTIFFRNYKSVVDFFNNHNNIYGHDRYIAYYCSLYGLIYRMDEYTAAYRMSVAGLWTKFSSFDKLKKNYSALRDFHLSVGIPANNEVLAETAFRISLLTFLYCLKRPRLLLKRENMSIIFSPWKNYNKMNRLKFALKVFKNRFFGK